MPGASSSMRLRWSGSSSMRSWRAGPAAEPQSGSSRATPRGEDARAVEVEPASVGDTDVLAVVDRAVDLVDDREGEVGAGDVRTALVVEEGDLPADAVLPGALTGRPGAVRAGGAHEQPVQVLRSTVGQQGAGRLALQRL